MDFGTHAMTFPQFIIRSQRFADAAAINALHAQAFGPGRFARSAYRVREQGGVDLDLSLTAWNGDELAESSTSPASRLVGKAGRFYLDRLLSLQTSMGKGGARNLFAREWRAPRPKVSASSSLLGICRIMGNKDFRGIPWDKSFFLVRLILTACWLRNFVLAVSTITLA